ncbi:amidohydrolase family protein [Neobacillus sp. NPDC097160]|uniref:N-acyl-D-amino-acid deacylase family protein n=1 Tax=Neobacillus sp. NPDC097160 TaxID=3364298 RepID=UPI003828A123
MFDIVIRNGFVLDGTGNPWTKIDIGIKNGIISQMGQLTNNKTVVEINAEGSIVAPGFIDTHVHSDLLCIKPDIHKIKILQGVTTELFGQDGISVAPVSNETKPLWQNQLKGLNGDIGDWPWNSIDEYLSFLENSELISNCAYLVPHGNIRTLIMGFEGRKASREEMVKMRLLVEEGMKQGAIGVSTGLIYPPNVYSCKEELIEICKGSAKYDGSFVVHMRNESNYSLEALEEVIDVARKSGVRLHISHFKIAGKHNKDKYKAALEMMDRAREEGIEVTFDQYPYPAGSTVLSSLLPPWTHSGGTIEMLRRLKDLDLKEKIKEEMEQSDDYDNFVRTCGWNGLVITSLPSQKNKIFEGKSIQEIADISGMTPSEVVFDLLIEENANIAMVNFWGDEEEVMVGMKHSLQMVGSDGIFGGKPHPRLYGTFPRILGRYVRENKTLTLPEAIRRMTGAPAQFMRLRNRGYIREGYFADVVIFDPKSIEDKATYKNSLQEPVGILNVIVNGIVAVKDGEFLGSKAGMVIRRDMN